MNRKTVDKIAISEPGTDDDDVSNTNVPVTGLYSNISLS